jgi:hypothetical protein
MQVPAARARPQLRVERRLPQPLQLDVPGHVPLDDRLDINRQSLERRQMGQLVEA